MNSIRPSAGMSQVNLNIIIHTMPPLESTKLHCSGKALACVVLSVGGCGARAVSRKTPIYFIELFTTNWIKLSLRIYKSKAPVDTLCSNFSAKYSMTLTLLGPAYLSISKDRGGEGGYLGDGWGYAPKYFWSINQDIFKFASK